MFNFLKYGFCFGVFLLIHLTGYAGDKDKLEIEEGCSSYVLIQGSSNINHFEFINYAPKIETSANNSIDTESYRNIEIPVHKFYGPNNRMLNDFFDLMKASKYPYIKIDIEPEGKVNFDETTGPKNFKAKISIAGTTQTYIIPCQINFCENSELVLEGKLEVVLSDFEIDPPRKALGTVRVNDEVFITFAFKYNTLRET